MLAPFRHPTTSTGPVTVPVLLALGVGVMDAQRQKRAALAVLEDAALKKSEGESSMAALLVFSQCCWPDGSCNSSTLFSRCRLQTVLRTWPPANQHGSMIVC